MKRFLKKFAVSRAIVLSSSAESIAIDGNENDIVAGLTFPEDSDTWFRLLEETPKGFLGKWIEGQEAYDACLPKSSADFANLDVRHFYKGLRITYTGPYDFLWGRLSGLAVRQLLWNRIIQTLFNRRTRFRRDRIELLKHMVELDLTHSNGEDIFWPRKEFQSFLTMSELYGDRVYAHPKINKESRRFQLIIDSLVESGELSKGQHTYTVNGKSLETISEFEVEERRHRDTIRQTWIMIILTVVIAFSTMVSIWI